MPHTRNVVSVSIKLYPTTRQSQIIIFCLAGATPWRASLNISRAVKSLLPPVESLWVYAFFRSQPSLVASWTASYLQNCCPLLEVYPRRWSYSQTTVCVSWLQPAILKECKRLLRNGRNLLTGTVLNRQCGTVTVCQQYCETVAATETDYTTADRWPNGVLKKGYDIRYKYLACAEKLGQRIQEAQLSPMDRAMRCVSWNLANCHATVQKLLVQVLNKSKLWSWRVKVGRCVINMCTQPWRIRVAFIVL